MENLSEKEEDQGQRIINPFIRGISSSCDDLLEEKLASDTNEPIGLITEAETQRPLRKESENAIKQIQYRDNQTKICISISHFCIVPYKAL